LAAPKEDKDLETIMTQLEAAYRLSNELPPQSDEAVDKLASEPAAVSDLDIESARRSLLANMARNASIGRLVADHRRTAGTDVEELAQRAGWSASRIELLEEDQIDLHDVEPTQLAGLLFAVGVESIGSVEAPLRKMAQEHLAIYESGSGRIYGRTRRSVNSADRRRGMMKGAVAIDNEATARAADTYLNEVQTQLLELGASRNG
jgi:hypothetical protein